MTNVRPTPEVKSRGYPPNAAKSEQSRRLISESKDILSDGSDSDVLVIDMGNLDSFVHKIYKSMIKKITYPN